MSQQSQNVTSHLITSLQHDKINLQKQLSECQLENEVLRRHLCHVSTLLDAAVSKLANLGIILDASINIRALRADAVRHANLCMTQPQMDLSESTGFKMKTPTHHSSKARFQLKTQFREHTKSVQCCAFSGGSDSFIVTGGLDHRLVVHDFLSSEKVWDVMGHSENISDVTWFEGTKNILSASYDGTVKLWDPRKNEASPQYQHNANGLVLSITSLDKSFVFACADVKGCTSIIDTRANNFFSWEHRHRVNSLVYDSSVGHLITGHSNGTISIWDIRMAGIVFSSSRSVPSTKDSLPNPSCAPGPIHASPASAFDMSNYQSKISTMTSTTLSGSVPNNSSFHWSEKHISSLAPDPIQPLDSWFNDQSKCAVSYLGFFYNNDGTKHLLSVSNENIVRIYRENLSTGRSNDPYHLSNVLVNPLSRGFPVRSGFWRGRKGKSQLPTFLDDEEKDSEMPVVRRVMESDLVVTGGPDNKATVFDVTEEGGAEVLEYLEGHRDRVNAAAVYESCNYPIIATCSADSIIRIWVPSKT